MKHSRYSGAAIVALVLGFLLCSGAATSVRADLVTGSGEWESRSSVAIRGTWTVTLERTGEAVKGTIALTGSPLFSGSEVKGTLEEDQLMFGTVVEGPNEVQFSGTLTDGRINGEWHCEAIGDSGSWSGGLRSTNTSDAP